MRAWVANRAKTLMTTHTQTHTCPMWWLSGRMLPEDRRLHSRHLPQNAASLNPLTAGVTGCNINASHTGHRKPPLQLAC